MSDRNTQNLAEKIAKVLQEETRNNDLGSLQKSIEKINQRLEKIENKLNTSQNSVPGTRYPNSHPSLEKYNVVEAIVNDVFESAETEKTCTFEPNGKPCDHCSMCNSHGF
jgi:archaellum component FlaC